MENYTIEGGEWEKINNLENNGSVDMSLDYDGRVEYLDMEYQNQKTTLNMLNKKVEKERNDKIKIKQELDILKNLFETKIKKLENENKKLKKKVDNTISFKLRIQLFQEYINHNKDLLEKEIREVISNNKNYMINPVRFPYINNQSIIISSIGLLTNVMNRNSPYDLYHFINNILGSKKQYEEYNDDKDPDLKIYYKICYEIYKYLVNKIIEETDKILNEFNNFF